MLGMVHHCVKQCITKHVNVKKDTTSKEWFVPNYSLEDGLRTQNMARSCMNMDGQKNKSDNTTQLALENHSYEAVPTERRRSEKNWHIV